MDSSDILMLLLGVALGTYFHQEVSGVIPLLNKEESKDSSTEV